MAIRCRGDRRGMAGAAMTVLALVAGCSGADVATPATVDTALVATVSPVATTVPAAAPELRPAPSPVAIPSATAVAVPTAAGPDTTPLVEAEETTPTPLDPEPTKLPESSAVPPAAIVAPTVVQVVSNPSSQEVLVANGAEVYTLNCARCHGENGLGTAQYSGVFGVGDKYSTAGMIAELTSGHPVTFGFADRLSADEIASVVAYVKATFP